MSHTPWRSLGFAPPRSWPRTIAIGIGFGVAFKLATQAIVMPLFGAPAINLRPRVFPALRATRVDPILALRTE